MRDPGLFGRISCHIAAVSAVAAFAASAGPSPAAEPVMVQCGREYQEAKAAGTLNGMDWNAYRTACADRLKAAPPPSAAAAPVTAPASAPAGPPPALSTRTAAPDAAPATAAVAAPPAVSAASPPPSGGAAAMHARQKQCGAEWTANKPALVAATPGLTWPKYWSQCNARIKATGR